MKPLEETRKWYSILLNNKGEFNYGDDDDDDDEIVIEDEEIEEEDDDKNKDEIVIDEDDEDDDEDDDVKARNKAFASMRVQNKELKDRLDRLENTQYTPPAKEPDPIPSGMPKTEEEWDALAEKDWKKAVDLRSTLNAQTLIQTQNQESKNTRILEESKQRVIASHPELNDNNSEKAKIFTQILNENPDYINHPKGPIFAMRDMEDYMENTLGYKRKDIVSAEVKGAKKEQDRQHRIVLNKGGGKINKPSKGKIVLNKDEMDFCKFNNIDPKSYAKNRNKLSSKK